MRIFRVDSQDDVEHGGHHLEREIQRGTQLYEQFHEKDQLVLQMLERCHLPAAPRFEICAVVSVDLAKKDGEWRFADDTTGQTKTATLHISNTYLTIWLRDDEGRAHRKLRFLFLKTVYGMMEKSPDDVQRQIGKDIADLMLQNIQKQNGQISLAALSLAKLQEEQELSIVQYAQLSNFR